MQDKTTLRNTLSAAVIALFAFSASPAHSASIPVFDAAAAQQDNLQLAQMVEQVSKSVE